MKLLHYKATAKCLNQTLDFVKIISKLALINIKNSRYSLLATPLLELKYKETSNKEENLEFDFKTYLRLKQLINIVEAIEDNYLMYRTMYQLTNASGKGFYCLPTDIFHEVIYGEEE